MLFHHHCFSVASLFHCSTITVALFDYESFRVPPSLFIFSLFHCSTIIVPLFHYLCSPGAPCLFNSLTIIVPLFHPHCSTISVLLFHHLCYIVSPYLFYCFTIVVPLCQHYCCTVPHLGFTFLQSLFHWSTISAITVRGSILEVKKNNDYCYC